MPVQLREAFRIKNWEISKKNTGSHIDATAHAPISTRAYMHQPRATNGASMQILLRHHDAYTITLLAMKTIF